MDGTQSFPEIVKLLIENGLQSTLILFFLTLIFGLILGMIIAKGRMSKLLIIQMPIRFFLLIMRGTPLILQLYGFYFGLYYIAGLSLYRFFFKLRSIFCRDLSKWYSGNSKRSV